MVAKYDTKPDLQAATIDATGNPTVNTKGKFTQNDGEQAAYVIMTPAEYNKTPDGDNEFFIANGNVAALVKGQTRLRNNISEEWNGESWQEPLNEPVVVEELRAPEAVLALGMEPVAEAEHRDDGQDQLLWM